MVVDVYMTKLAMKVNTKLGGINQKLCLDELAARSLRGAVPEETITRLRRVMRESMIIGEGPPLRSASLGSHSAPGQCARYTHARTHARMHASMARHGCFHIICYNHSASLLCASYGW